MSASCSGVLRPSFMSMQGQKLRWKPLPKRGAIITEMNLRAPNVDRAVSSARAPSVTATVHGQDRATCQLSLQLDLCQAPDASGSVGTQEAVSI
mmetsp:Transcript_61103/g.132440  ORF Transcript_61103/g.132440 Transcript_61103/m.132440 type:complete len:94 (-) Transcript_61103:128-409(-)|eukprot:CAMPEP_0170602038 /NCGR_PEP_ID=MMETSP0224-20130122/18180_1 /TAXON_ID=285029 /ORGANISM="Togula jolla, Strain CCCM 725" /LENGTH=93 /DNA_ID=CAMNT_0010926855 /DNA_START=72 /DNA_END=353 /DNA_ORIENTATION=-